MKASKTTVNPFLNNGEFHLKVVQVYKRSIQGQGYFVQESTSKFIVEEQQKVSVYKIGNNAEFTTFLFQVLSGPGRNLFLYIMSNIGENRDTINLNTEKVSKAMGISRNTHYAGIESLRDNGVITMYKKDEHWVNPFFIFRGDRISYYQDVCPDCIKIAATVSTGDRLLGGSEQ